MCIPLVQTELSLWHQVVAGMPKSGTTVCCLIFKHVINIDMRIYLCFLRYIYSNTYIYRQKCVTFGSNAWRVCGAPAQRRPVQRAGLE